MKVKSLSRVQLFATPWTCSLPGSSVHGIFRARVLKSVAISFSRGSSQPRDQTRVSWVVGRHFNRLSHQGSGKEPAFQCLRHGFSSWVWKIPWRRAQQSTPVFLPGESHGHMVHKVTKSQTRLKQLSTRTVTDAFSRLYQLLFSKSSVRSSYHFLISPEFLLHFHSVSYPEPVVFFFLTIAPPSQPGKKQSLFPEVQSHDVKATFSCPFSN